MKAPERYTKCHEDWSKNAKRLQYLLVPLGICSITASAVVAAFTHELGEFWTRVFATVSSLSVGYLTYFQIPKKIEDLWLGWKHLNGYLGLYEEGKITLERLNDEYLKAEKMVGVMEIKAEALSPTNPEN